jgi:hypothetical protein
MYGVITTVPAPVEMYDKIHRRVGPSVEGLLVHVGRATTDGFQTVEVWQSKEHYDRQHRHRLPPDAGTGRRSTSTLSRAGYGNLRGTRPYHPQRQHHDLTDGGSVWDAVPPWHLQLCCVGHL